MAGRKKQFAQRIVLPLEEGMPELIDSVLKPKEARVDFIRTAIERELNLRLLEPKSDAQQ